MMTKEREQFLREYFCFALDGNGECWPKEIWAEVDFLRTLICKAAERIEKAEKENQDLRLRWFEDLAKDREFLLAQHAELEELRAWKKQREAETQVRLPVIKYCGQCSCADKDCGERVCTHPHAGLAALPAGLVPSRDSIPLPRIDFAASPPSWCPLRTKE